MIFGTKHCRILRHTGEENMMVESRMEASDADRKEPCGKQTMTIVQRVECWEKTVATLREQLYNTEATVALLRGRMADYQDRLDVVTAEAAEAHRLLQRWAHPDQLSGRVLKPLKPLLDTDAFLGADLPGKRFLAAHRRVCEKSKRRKHALHQLNIALQLNAAVRRNLAAANSKLQERTEEAKECAEFAERQCKETKKNATASAMRALRLSHVRDAANHLVHGENDPEKCHATVDVNAESYGALVIALDKLEKKTQ